MFSGIKKIGAFCAASTTFQTWGKTKNSCPAQDQKDAIKRIGPVCFWFEKKKQMKSEGMEAQFPMHCYKELMETNVIRSAAKEKQSPKACLCNWLFFRCGGCFVFLTAFLIFFIHSSCLYPSFLPPSFPPSLPPSLLPSLPPCLLASLPPSLLPSFPPSLLPSFSFGICQVWGCSIHVDSGFSFGYTFSGILSALWFPIFYLHFGVSRSYMCFSFSNSSVSKKNYSICLFVTVFLLIYVILFLEKWGGYLRVGPQHVETGRKKHFSQAPTVQSLLTKEIQSAVSEDITSAIDELSQPANRKYICHCHYHIIYTYMPQTWRHTSVVFWQKRPPFRPKKSFGHGQFFRRRS